MGLATPESVREKLAPFTDVPIEGVGTFRVKRLSITERLELLGLLRDVKSDESGKTLNTAENIAALVAIVCKALIDEEGSPIFDNEAGREVVMGLDDVDFMQLSNVVLPQIGITRSKLNPKLNENDAGVEEAKNE